jgi:hypothetical protein
MNIIFHSLVVDLGGTNATENGEKKTIKRYEGKSFCFFFSFFLQR